MGGLSLTAVVFDFDGTLVDTNKVKRSGFFEVVATDPQGSETMAAVLDRVTGDRRKIFETYLADRLPQHAPSRSQHANELTAAYSYLVDARVAFADEIEGASALLHGLRRAGMRLYLSSATPLDNLQHIIEQRQWTHHFDEIFGAPTPKVDTLRNLVRRHGGQATQIAVVGDGEDDRSSARDVGCAFFPVGDFRSGRNSDTRIFSLKELAALLLDTRDRE